ncbi:SWIM zinc finger domain-containing protein [Microcoleus vaginatus PCC 9802]|uniref:SWIM zinc finger family protein n=1 Tax=Microcoleus vaginatus TaxID=119532 RepID=UPI00020D19F7|nr:zinc finger SWIM domain-containing protein [Microcoleus vaginatus FGP-2]UNU20287.1 SWIM zinc finger domain-containing protein [Microcoleus vaginatus PCC 9802]
MPIPKLSETTIEHHTSAQSLKRGEAYYLAGNVIRAVRRGNMVQAVVEGSEVEPYRVTLPFDDAGLASTLFCTCPYDNGGWCKHIVATLLLCLRQPEIIEQGPTLEQLLDRLNDVQTQQLIQHLVKKEPSLIDAIERYINLSAIPAPSNQPTKAPRHTSIDPAPFRHQVRRILREAVRYFEDGWEEEDPISEELLDVIQRAQEFSEQGDGNNALVILEAITTACVEDWDDVEEFGAENYEIANALNEAWTEAILTAQLTAEEEIDLQVMLEAWQDEWNCDFSMSLEALRQGWDDPLLQQVLEGNITGSGVWAGDAPDCAHDLSLIRLQILDRQERDQEYLYLAQAEGCTQQYLTMLTRLGRVEEAVEAAATQMQSAEDALALVQTLKQQGALEQALKICQAGLNLSGHCHYQLATSMSELAVELGEDEVALNARIQIFKIQPSFRDYSLVKELAKDSWSTLKADLLATLKSNETWNFTNAKVDIFLDEGMIEDAIALADGLGYYESALIHRVMGAAISHSPDWVIANACRRAASIMDQGKSSEYTLAIKWLEKARAAYLHTGQNLQWSAYRSQLMQVHSRKRKLMEMLKSPNLD